MFADDNIEFAENGRKFSKWLENTVGKGEIARYEQFLLFPQCFQKTCTADTLKPGLVSELQIYGAPEPMMQDFIKWRTNFQGKAPVGRILFGCE